MGRQPPPPRAPSVAGFVLRLARESASLTQARLGEALMVDVDTVQGWESGRRPLSNVKAGVLLELRRRLPALGAEPGIVAVLEAAMDADRVLAAGLGAVEGQVHPLAGWVHTRETAHLLSWALTGTTPPALAGRLPRLRRGPAATAPVLSAGQREAFFVHLRETTERAARHDEEGALLHRQALYLASYDHGPDAAAWTRAALHRGRDVLARRGFSPHWAGARSTATALARQGDPQPLLDFIDRALADDDTAEAANLNYWAYWVGAMSTPQPDDAFMTDRALAGWDPVTLLRGLARGLHVAPGYVDLYAHTLWALLVRFPWLPQAAGQIAGPLRVRTGQLLDGAELSARSRRELGRVHYGLDHNR
ncbi:XRE family transcriptional regulator [Streptomyces cinereoruber]|uniref:XRE family transcriptional regulator n=1 Tax=Streptomyces cinereoruber TaxID=67260 RepID=A0ABX6B7F2_9ACTN|nr:XRE family transcriptional regulator [Streptomyces cinereoruber]